jgi:hypothetical protein
VCALARGATLAALRTHVWRLEGPTGALQAPVHASDDPTALGEQDLVLVMINGWTDELTFTLPSAGSGRTWRLAGDTCSASEGPEQIAMPGTERPLMGTSVRVCGRGLALLVAR